MPRKECICPSCGRSVDREQFLKNGTCKKCGADLKNFGPAIRYFNEDSDFLREFENSGTKRNSKPKEEKNPVKGKPLVERPKEQKKPVKTEPKAEQKKEPKAKPKTEPPREQKTNGRVSRSMLDKLKQEFKEKESPEKKPKEPFSKEPTVQIKKTIPKEEIPLEESAPEVEIPEEKIEIKTTTTAKAPSATDAPSAPVRTFIAPDEPEDEPESEDEEEGQGEKFYRPMDAEEEEKEPETEDESENPLYMKYTDPAFVELLVMRSGKDSAEKELKDATALALASSDFESVAKISALLSGLDKDSEEPKPKEPVEEEPKFKEKESEPAEEPEPTENPEPVKEEFEPTVETPEKAYEEPHEEPKTESVADKMRRMAEEEDDIYSFDYMGPNESKEETDFDSNTDGYYDDVQSDVPPQPDIIKKSSIYKALAFVIGILLLIFFLIYYA